MKPLISFLSFNVLAATLLTASMFHNVQAQNTNAPSVEKKSETKIKIVTIENGEEKVKEFSFDRSMDEAAIRKALQDAGVNVSDLPPLPSPPPEVGDAPEPPMPPQGVRKTIIRKKIVSNGDTTIDEDVVIENIDGDGHRRGRHHGDGGHHKKGRHHRHHHDITVEMESTSSCHKWTEKKHCKGSDSAKCHKKIVMLKKTDKNTAAARKGKTTKTSILDLYPNPSNGQFNVSYKAVKDEGELTVIVSDMKGREVLREKVKATEGNIYEQAIDLSKQPKGTYVVTLSGGKVKKSEKVVIQ
jgi:hypothetical protein